LLTSKALSNVQAIRWESFAVRYEDGSNQQVATHDDGGEGTARAERYVRVVYPLCLRARLRTSLGEETSCQKGFLGQRR
jgi:hypothetical protein